MVSSTSSSETSQNVFLFVFSSSFFPLKSMFLRMSREIKFQTENIASTRVNQKKMKSSSKGTCHGPTAE